MNFVPRLLNALALCVALLAAGEVAAAPLKVVGRFLQDTHGNNILMRGVNVPVYKSGYADDLDAVAAAIALTQCFFGAICGSGPITTLKPHWTRLPFDRLRIAC